MTPIKKNILFYIGTLEGGGAERVLIELLKNLNREKYKLFITLNRPEGAFFNRIPDDVKLLDRSQLYRSKTNLFKRYFGLASIIKNEKIDLAMGFLPGANRSLLRSHFLMDHKVTILLNEQNNPSFISSKEQSLFKKKLEKMEMSRYYSKADGMVVSCEGLKDNFLNRLNLSSVKIHVIYNMIPFDEIQYLSRKPVEGVEFDNNLRTIVAVGRLTEQKAYNDMLSVFKSVNERVPSRLIILGEGPDRSKIEAQIQQLDLKGSVLMPGFVDNPFSFMSKADLYVSTSRWEGFHLTIAEAMACGTVPVATDCDYGPREIISDRENGRLFPVGDTQALSNAVVDLLENEKLRKEMSDNAVARARDFDVNQIVKEYEKVFDDFLSN